MYKITDIKTFKIFIKINKEESNIESAMNTTYKDIF
ncbi:hypothetical protein OTSSIDO_0549 [Orientia tsutsugamushi str. Sido]|uniref:Uncharacterized protein n=1 Tax=Orientia tsutsugamushi TaxID=784 RepID=A0A2U3RR51_ORITS|nr:hypothetical protein OTSKARP_1340 [Orientia tsutsugamushi str. Karp]KJW01807.1 hypothetical protein OTSSIDO_0549 [Orientia tsutsugamushi str. Sido]SPR12869.1 Uncharacterised protein [Orientia tsutsugamushi]SPR15725.1 Uncharacterised protein [Orientia tsutsugamushi]